ncbi:MAG: TonB-dependent receptor plug domain-containing protein [Pseudohongiellaceae bacterium]|nr:TonB-dependent receptor plug domain-containing protein [Pseudohongiellaceae bacterium]
MSFRILSASLRAVRQRLPISTLAAGALLLASVADAQEATGNESTVTYPASFFEQYEPFSVNDMLNRIPGISTARGGNGGGPGSSGGANRRGLGAGGDQILINGRRVAGKENEGNSQLSRIPANQVDYIEIIRGTSGDLDVRGGGQVINIVLLEAESRSSIAAEVNMDRYQGDTLDPGGSISLTGQRGALNYLLAAEREPRYQYRNGFETSILGDYSPNDTVVRKEYTNSAPMQVSANIGYDLTPNDRVNLNALYGISDSPNKADRIITDLTVSPSVKSYEHDRVPATSDNWEIGGDYEHSFANGNRFKTLFIVNETDSDSTRESFDILPAGNEKYLYLANQRIEQERIIRSSYTMGLTDTQDIEFGIERAQTILDAQLQQGILSATGTPSAAFGGLVPVGNTDARVEEMRYETFIVHNWKLNDRMSLESTLLFENSTIEQTGDVRNKRDFDFIRPKIDYRFDITPSIQFRASIEKDVAQLSFADFTASTASGDDDQNALAGNPDLRQEQSIRYEMNLEYRLPNDEGVFSSQVFYHELEDVIDRIDVSTATTIASANGNIGDGERYGLALDGSLRLGFLGNPEMLVTSGLRLEDSKVTDPFLGIDRRLRQNGRGRFSLGFRHDIPSRNMNYGFNFYHNFSGNNKLYDINKIEDYDAGDQLSLWFETIGFGGLTYRFETMNTLNTERCRIRSRYVGGTIATGSLDEIEDSCSVTGVKYAIKIRGTF